MPAMMGNQPMKNDYVSGLEKSVAKKTVVPQRQANRFTRRTNSGKYGAYEGGKINRTQAKAMIMERRSERNTQKSQAMLDASGTYGKAVGPNLQGSIRPQQKKMQGEAARLFKKSERQATKAAVYRKREKGMRG